jgi:hypothetical protein
MADETSDVNKSNAAKSPAGPPPPRRPPPQRPSNTERRQQSRQRCWRFTCPRRITSRATISTCPETLAKLTVPRDGNVEDLASFRRETRVRQQPRPAPRGLRVSAPHRSPRSDWAIARHAT